MKRLPTFIFGTYFCFLVFKEMRYVLVGQIPTAVGATLGSALDWAHLTAPDRRTCLGMKGGRCLWHAGRVLGGGGAINGMMYVRGDQEDYDSWERAGNPGWGWRHVVKYFRKSEVMSSTMYFFIFYFFVFVWLWVLNTYFLLCCMNVNIVDPLK